MKKHMKKYVCLLLVLLLVCVPAGAFNFKDSLPELQVQPVQPSNEEKPWLPDPEGVFGVPGELSSQEEYAGVMYSLYSYRFYMDIEELVDAEFAYRDRLEEHHGYTALEAEPGNALSYVMLYHEACARPAELGIFIEDEADMPYGGQGLMEAVLAVPEGYDFVPGEYPSYERECGLCEGSGKCGNCFGGRTDYGAGMVDCRICGGSDTCKLCGGTGIY